VTLPLVVVTVFVVVLVLFLAGLLVRVAVVVVTVALVISSISVAFAGIDKRRPGDFSVVVTMSSATVVVKVEHLANCVPSACASKTAPCNFGPRHAGHARASKRRT